MAVAKGEVITSDDAAPASAVIITIIVAVSFQTAPYARAILPEDPHVDGRDAIIPEMEGAPPAQVPTAGKRLPRAVQEHIVGGRELGLHP